MMTEADIAEGRAIAESTMRDECAVMRKIGTTTDPNRGALVDEFATIYIGKCAVKMRPAGSTTTSQSGEQSVTLTKPELQVPADVDLIEVDDKAVLLASRSPGMAGRALKVTGPWLQTISAACRYPCVESSVPEPGQA